MRFQNRKPESRYAVLMERLNADETMRHLIEQDLLAACCELRMLASVESHTLCTARHQTTRDDMTWLSTLIDNACRYAFDHLLDFRDYMGMTEAEKSESILRGLGLIQPATEQEE